MTNLPWADSRSVLCVLPVANFAAPDGLLYLVPWCMYVCPASASEMTAWLHTGLSPYAIQQSYHSSAETTSEREDVFFAMSFSMLVWAFVVRSMQTLTNTDKTLCLLLPVVGHSQCQNNQGLQFSGNHMPAGTSLVSSNHFWPIQMQCCWQILAAGPSSSGCSSMVTNPITKQRLIHNITARQLLDSKNSSAQIAYVAAAPSCNVLQWSSQQKTGTHMTHHVKETPWNAVSCAAPHGTACSRILKVQRLIQKLKTAAQPETTI